MGREWLNKTEEEDFKAKVKKLGADYMEPLGYSTKHGVFIGPEIFMQNSSYFWADNEWNHRNESSGWKIALSIDSIGSVRIGVINPSCNNFETRRKLEDDEVKFLLETLTKLTAKKSSKKKKK